MGNIKYLLILFLICSTIASQEISVARIKYNGGGDWYNGRTELPNLLSRFSSELNVKTAQSEIVLEASSTDIFDFPMLFITGHGRVIFSQKERLNLRKYCRRGGLLYIDDDFGMDKFIREELKKIFPGRALVPLNPDFPLFGLWFVFPEGLPQIHIHEDSPPEAWGIFDDSGNLMVLYTYNSNISDGWDSPGVHPEDTPEIRETALRMGVNILLYAILY
ncbi:DUF4159 domain-containing protein [bacterium]|nr:DUF4159 domain-containing protein [bacterium]